MSLIQINDLEVFGYHGVYPEEKSKGQTFVVNIDLWVDTSKSEISDNLDETINYQTVCDCVQKVIDGPSCNLLERLARKIIDEIRALSEDITGIQVMMNKPSPPMTHKTKGGVSVTLFWPED